LQPHLRAIIQSIEPTQVREHLREVFSDLNRLLGYADRLKAALRLGDSDGEALFILDVVRSESLAAASGMDFLCEQAELPADLAEELGRAGFAIRHEVRTVFGRILQAAPLAADGTDTHSRLADAQDILRNCFQQSAVSLARLFRPALDAADLFDDIRVKRDNSLRLYEDLNALLRSARHAERCAGADALSVFSERLEDFRSVSMCHLMQKDVETCQRFVEDFRAGEGRENARFFLRRFTCYLEILLKHVGQRSVLSNQPTSMAA
jgi:hypothetical protein